MNSEDYGAMLDRYSAYGAIASAISLAKDAGILDILHNAEDGLTSEEIADKGGLKERYVQEILGSLVTGGVVQVDQTSTNFYVNPEFKPILKAKAIMTRFVPYYGEVYGSVLNCCAKPGPAGMQYSDVVFDIMDELRQEDQDRLLDQDLLPSAPGLVDKLESGIDVAEIGSGNGILTLNLCQRFPKSRFTGSDIVQSVLDVARMRGDDLGLTNCDFAILDVCHIPECPPKQYDWIFARDVIHDLPDPQGALSGMRKMLKPGGIFSMVEYGIVGSLAENVGNTDVSYLYASSVFMCIPESYQGQESAALGPCWGVEKARAMIAKAGLELVNEHRKDLTTNEVTFVCQRPM